MGFFTPERNKPFKCKTILLFCPPGWELTEMGLFRYAIKYINVRLKNEYQLTEHFIRRSRATVMRLLSQTTLRQLVTT